MREQRDRRTRSSTLMPCPCSKNALRYGTHSSGPPSIMPTCRCNHVYQGDASIGHDHPPFWLRKSLITFIGIFSNGLPSCRSSADIKPLRSNSCRNTSNSCPLLSRFCLSSSMFVSLLRFCKINLGITIAPTRTVRIKIVKYFFTLFRLLFCPDISFILSFQIKTNIIVFIK